MNGPMPHPEGTLSSHGTTNTFVRWWLRLQRLPPWLAVVAVACLLAACWLLVYLAGGTRTAFPHAFYLPIVLAAVPFGVKGGLVAGVVAALLAGPLMPLNVATGESQELVNWLARGAFFVLIGGASGSTTLTLRRGFEAELSEQLWGEVESATATATQRSDPAWADRVRRAIDSGGFRAVFQPIYTLDDGRLFAVEALTRFHGDPPATPNLWFDEAHRANLGRELELATVAVALDASAGLPDDAVVTFNASPSLLTDPRLFALLDRHDGRRLIAEVTEHAIVDDYGHLAEALGVLRARGVLLAVDDAGAGFASLRHIVRLQPDFIKLDPSLTQNLGNDPIRRPLAECLIQFANRTACSIVVEGVETAADLAAWQELGAHAAQGYLLGRPGDLPAEAYYLPLTGSQRRDRPRPVPGRPA